MFVVGGGGCRMFVVGGGLQNVCSLGAAECIKRWG